MSIFNLLTLFGGLAMFLYGMNYMGSSLRENSGGAMKRVMESVTNNPIKAFFLGLLVTAVIQSSTATIVITAGLVGAGIITLRQSLGIIVGANVGTTVTGQIIRLMDLDTGGMVWLQIFKASTLAPVALIIGIILYMFIKKGNSKTIGGILLGFGILFVGLMNMTESVDSINETGAFDSLFTTFGNSPVLGYASGAGVAFILQSSSASVGILQALSSSGQLTFKSIYAILAGIYLGDCVTTGIVCYIGANADTKRVAIVNIIFNLFKTVILFLGVFICFKTGVIAKIWEAPIDSGGIANANTVFNLVSAVILLPTMTIFEKWSCKIVKDDQAPTNKYDDKLQALSPNFFRSPSMALDNTYEVLLTMLTVAKKSIMDALALFSEYDEKIAQEIIAEEDNVDIMNDKVSDYLVALSPHIKQEGLAAIMDEYYKDVTEFERLSDHAMNLCEAAGDLRAHGYAFSDRAQKELVVITDLIGTILQFAEEAFKDNNVEAARNIEPLEEVVDDMVNALRDNHIARLRDGICNTYTGTNFLNLLGDLERISDICSNIGVNTVARSQPKLANEAHAYVSALHSGNDSSFNEHYRNAHDAYFGRLAAVENEAKD